MLLELRGGLECGEQRRPFHVARSEEMKQAIRATSPDAAWTMVTSERPSRQDRHPNATTPSSSQQEDEKGEDEEEQSNKRPRLDEGAVAVVEEETKDPEEDEDSEPSSDEGRSS